MDSQYVTRSKSNLTENAEFYTESPFRSFRFKVLTFMFGMDLLMCAMVLIKGWRYLSLSTTFLIALALVYLFGFWSLSLRVHEKIRALFDSAQIEMLERNSPLDKVLSANMEMMLGGLFGALFIFGSFLVVVGKVVFSH